MTSLPRIEIYYSPLCGYCIRALAILDHYQVLYDKFNVLESSEHKKTMLARVPDAATVPQIFIDGDLIGGSDELSALHKKGTLRTMLKKDNS